MDFFGKKIDPETIDKINQILNSAEGQKLKQELSGMDTDKLADKLKELNLSDVDLKDVADKIEKTNKTEIVKQLKNISNMLFKNGR